MTQNVDALLLKHLGSSFESYVPLNFSISIVAAFALVSVMNVKHGMRLKLEYFPGGWAAQFKHPSGPGKDYSIKNQATPALAITLAAINALGLKLEE